MNRKTTILNVEDTEANRFLIRRILESEGFNVVDAINALDGIEKAKSVHPDLILMDINLPDLDGFTAASRIRGFPELARVPILAVTARTVHDDRARAKAIGIDGYLNKPIDFDEIVQEINRHLKKGHVVAEAETQREYYLQEQNLNLISELEHKFSELQHTYNRLKQFDDTKNDFISVVSHELRTPLTVIDSNAQLLKMLPNMPQDEMTEEIIDGILRGANRLHEIINDMVSVIRFELANEASAHLTPISVGAVLRSVEAGNKDSALQRQQTFIVDIAPDLPPLLGDSQQLSSAISRIVNNAIKFTPDGGTIRVTAHRHAPTRSGGSESIKIVVADTGVGIAADKQRLIFEKFATATNTALHSSSKTNFMGGGAGLGLTIAKGIIKAHQGEIWVESKGYSPDLFPGSKFHITLPSAS